jgi:hypothetical protein
VVRARWTPVPARARRLTRQVQRSNCLHRYISAP